MYECFFFGLLLLLLSFQIAQTPSMIAKVRSKCDVKLRIPFCGMFGRGMGVDSPGEDGGDGGVELVNPKGVGSSRRQSENPGSRIRDSDRAGSETGRRRRRATADDSGGKGNVY